MAKKKNYTARLSEKELNIRFYEGLDYDFLYHKAHISYLCLENWNDFKGFEAEHEFTYMEGDEADIKRKQALAAEIFFTSIHLTEALFVLLLARFQPIPDWLYLTTYRTNEIFDYAKSYLNGDTSKLPNVSETNNRDFLVKSFTVSSAKSEEDFFESYINSCDEFLKRALQRYIEHGEYGGPYGAYKHGARIHTGGMEIAVGLSSEEMATVISSEYGISWISSEEVTSNDNTVRKFKLLLNQQAIDYKESFEYILQMCNIIKTLKQARIACIRGLGASKITVAEINLDELDGSISSQKISYSL